MSDSKNVKPSVLKPMCLGIDKFETNLLNVDWLAQIKFLQLLLISSMNFYTPSSPKMRTEIFLTF